MEDRLGIVVLVSNLENFIASLGVVEDFHGTFLTLRRRKRNDFFSTLSSTLWIQILAVLEVRTTCKVLEPSNPFATAHLRSTKDFGFGLNYVHFIIFINRRIVSDEFGALAKSEFIALLDLLACEHLVGVSLLVAIFVGVNGFFEAPGRNFRLCSLRSVG